jgi:hypothetical protein
VLKSLFGDLMPTSGEPSSPVSPMTDFAATAILETNNTAVTDTGRMVDRRQEDVYFSGSPGAAIRDHLARTPPDPDVRLITMLDPSRMWAPGVVKALSDATGQPVERLLLRDEDSEEVRVTLERTAVPRRSEATLKIYHADTGVQSQPQADNIEAPLALMERSHLAAVIVGAMSMPDIAALMTTLRRSVRTPNWTCGTLLFLLPPGQLGLSTRIAQLDWPSSLRVEVLDEPLTSTSSVWNALLSAWDRANAPVPAAGSESPAPGSMSASGVPHTVGADTSLSPSTLANLASGVAVSTPASAPLVAPTSSKTTGITTPPAAAAPKTAPRNALHQAAQHAALVQRHLRELIHLPGVVACGLADVEGGELVAGLTAPDVAAKHDAQSAASALAALAHANRAATLALDANDPATEVVTTTEQFVHVLRPCVHNTHLFLFARFKRHQGNPALVKLQLAETDRALIVTSLR